MSLVDLGKRLLESAKLGETEEVRILMTNGAPFTTDWLGISPLHLAAQFGHLDTAEVLLRGGISRDARTKVDRTPLHIAAQEGHYEIVELLITQGAEVDAKDMLKMTPLHWAVERSHLHVVKLLLLYKADVHAVSKFEKTPVDIAEDNRDEQLIEILTKHLTSPISVKKYNPGKSSLMTSNQTNVISDGQNIKALPFVLKSETACVSSSKVATNSVFVTSPLRKSANILDSAVNNMIKSPTVSKPMVFHTNLETLQKAAVSNSAIKKISSSDSEEGESNETSSTSVLATLAALAEATAPNSSISTTEALQWLGITMLPPDNSTIVASAVEGGQTVSLTEAGKLALTWVKEHQNLNSDSMDVSSSVSDAPIVTSQASNTSQKVITIVADQAHIPSITSSPQTPIVVLNSQPSIPKKDSEPAAKKMKKSILTETCEFVTNGDVTSSDEDEKLKLKKELERMKKEAELYKAQFLAKEFEAQNYKKQLEEMRIQPKNFN